MRYLGRDTRGNVAELRGFGEELEAFRELMRGEPHRQTTMASRVTCWLSGYLDSHGIEAILVERDGGMVPFFWREKSTLETRRWK